ncbi:protein TRC8 homolog isoform X1 [Trichoplusia ni]|uniref:Protein TRC8 homolog isoform X1 n=2 Tax=Trichoplusia ni TaxID=7111 RepID=A0A7E5WYD9_TRINI|nr:protein TRC8 homolog isoform X1 [Trichoplusia ni]
MSLRSKALALVEVLLRVPPLFVVDEFLKISLGLPVSSGEEVSVLSNVTVDHVDFADADVNYYDANFYNAFFFTLLKFLVCCLGCMSALCIFVLYTKHLIIVYLYLTSVGLVFVSYWTNVSAIKQIQSLTLVANSPHQSASILEDMLNLNLKNLLDLEGPGILVIQNFAIQFMLAVIFKYVHLGPRQATIQKLLPISFMAPSFLAMLPVPPNLLHHSPVFSALLPLVLVKYVLWSSAYNVIQVVYAGYQHGRLFVSNYGLSALVETEWMRLNVPCVLRVFWVLRVAEHAILLLMDNYDDEAEEGLKVSTLLAVQSLASMAKSLLVTGCETITAVLGMTSVISFFCHYIGNFFQWILLAEEEEDKSIGTVSAILFYILALQTGLTSLNPEKRFIRLCRNFCLLFTALLHFLHNIVNPMLMSLSASHNPSTHRHIRALGVCAFLIMFPISLLVYLWSQHTISTWLLAVSAFSIEVIVKVVVSLMIYSLFLIDACRNTFWEQLDDYVYYIRAFGNTIEFCFGIFLFFNGAWILLFESGGAIRAVMMCIHAYFNIWCEARAGWSVFMKRRTAVNKINSLREASPDQLNRLDDVCAICYQEMHSAKITRCNHYFHGVCLRKWLYVQDRCPLCHDILYKIDSDANKDSGSETGNEENSNNQNLLLEEDPELLLGQGVR